MSSNLLPITDSNRWSISFSARTRTTSNRPVGRRCLCTAQVSSDCSDDDDGARELTFSTSHSFSRCCCRRCCQCCLRRLFCDCLAISLERSPESSPYPREMSGRSPGDWPAQYNSCRRSVSVSISISQDHCVCVFKWKFIDNSK